MHALISSQLKKLRIFFTLSFLSILGALTSCAGPPASQLRAETDPIRWTSQKKAIDISECVSLAWEPLLIPNFVFVKPMAKGYRIDKTSDTGHLYLSVDIIESEGTTEVSFWTTKYIWLNSQREEAGKAVISCL